MFIRLANHERTPLPYPGGKTRMVEKLSLLRPAAYTEYREPFLGGGSMFFHIRRHHPCGQYWLNDADPKLVTFYRVLRDHPEAFISRQEAIFAEHGGGSERLYKQWLTWVESTSDLDIASAIFLRPFIVRGSDINNYGYARKNVETDKGLTFSKIQRLWGFSALLRGVKITNLDYREVMNAQGDNVFVFCDPPYEEAGLKLYQFGRFDLQEFSDAVHGCDHKLLVTLNDSDGVRSEFATYQPIVHQHHWSFNGNRKGTEVIFANYDTPLFDIYANQIGERLTVKSAASINDNDQPKYTNTIFNQSCEDMSVLPDNSVHLTVTSPPYNVGIPYGDAVNDNQTVDDYLTEIRMVFEEVYRVTAHGGRLCININNTGRKPYIPLTAHFHLMMQEIGFHGRGEIIWNKGGGLAGHGWGSHGKPSNPVLRDIHEYILVFTKGDYCRTDLRECYRGIKPISSNEFADLTRSVWNITPEKASRIGHPVPYPLELPRRLIKLYSGEGDVVLDPFLGSGTTAVAAIEQDRHFVGFELEQKYIDIAEARIAAALDKKVKAAA